jgi:orotate phosphoribosyltransferase
MSQGIFDAHLDEAEHLVRSAAEEIWQRPFDQWYTDHTIEHSDRIILHVRNLQAAWQLNDSELRLLRFAAYLHDIGMQFRDWGGSSASMQPRKTIAAVLNFGTHKQSAEWIRQRHADLGRALIEAELRRKRTWLVPPAFARVGSGHEADFLWNCARVAFAHTTGRSWDEFRTAKDAIEAQGPSGEPLRLWLLVGVLRIADELDGCKWRVPVFERIAHADTPDESIPHWLACWFVEELRSSGSDLSIDVTVKWRVPDDANDEELDEIRRLLQRFRRQKLQQTVDEVNAYFSHLERKAMQRELHVRGLDDGDLPSARWPVSEDRKALRSAVQSALIKGGWRRPGQDYSRARGKNPPSADLEIELRNWVLASRRGVRQGHFSLERGLHTDRLVNCRSLGARQELVKRVADWIATGQAAVEHCVAVGTSMIPFALEAARRFDSSVTFTFGVPTLRFGEQVVDRFTKVEVSPFLPAKMRSVLILDDIIAVGEGARLVIELVKQGRRRSDLRIIHYSLFRLGNKRFFKVPGVEYRWACWIKDVNYWNPGRCPKCSIGEVCVPEADIWG